MQDNEVQTLTALLQTARESYQNNPPEALQAAKDALSYACEIKNVAGQAAALGWHGAALWQTGDYTQGEAEIREAILKAAESAVPALEADMRQLLANVLFANARYEDAAAELTQVVALNKMLDRKHAQGSALLLLGGVYTQIGAYEVAQPYYVEALEISQTFHDDSLRASVHANIGFLHLTVDSATVALPHLDEAIALLRNLDSGSILVQCYACRADAYRMLHRFQEATQDIDRAFRLCSERDLRQPATRVLRSRAFLLMAQGKLDTALQAFAEAEDHLQQVGAHRFLAELLWGFAVCYWSQGNAEKALNMLVRAEEHAQEEQNRRILLRIWESRALWAESQDDLKTALTYYKKFHGREEARERETLQLLLHTKLAEQATQQARRETEQIQRKNEELSTLVSALEKANAEKLELLNRLQEKADALARQATEDALTGLFNRRYLDDFLAREVSRSKRHRANLTVAIGDLDNFKRVNDTFSHQIGDVVLKAVARLFLENSRLSDVAVRYGGEEFALVLPDTTAEEAEVVCERIRAAIAEYDWKRVHPDLVVTVSIGIAQGADEEAAALLYRADMRLYQAKQSGKNRVVV